MNLPQVKLLVRNGFLPSEGFSPREDRSAMLRWSSEQAGLPAWHSLPVSHLSVLPEIQRTVLADRTVDDDSLLVFLEGDAHLVCRRFYEPDQFARRLVTAMTEAAADILLSSCTVCHPATAKLVTLCDRHFGKVIPNRYISQDGWVARAGALRRLVRRHGERSLMEARWWAEVTEVTWGNYGNQPRIALDHECRVFQPLDDMVRDLAPAPYSLINSRTGEHPMFLQRASICSLGPWMEMLWPSGPGPTWERYLGEYEKQPYDVVLDSGELLVEVWPNAGTFNDMSGGDRTVPCDRAVWMRAREIA